MVANLICNTYIRKRKKIGEFLTHAVLKCKCKKTYFLKFIFTYICNVQNFLVKQNYRSLVTIALNLAHKTSFKQKAIISFSKRLCVSVSYLLE